MTPIKVIGAGLGRSGTDSLRNALDILGYKTHHIKCFYEDARLDPDAFYNAYKNREQANWDTLYHDYDAAVDWTGATFYKDLLKTYPHAKVILTVRSADSWYASVEKTISKVGSTFPPIMEGSPIYAYRRLVKAVCMDGWIQDPDSFGDKEKTKHMYLDHIKEVKRVVPKDQLLVLELGEGWEKLCPFLEKDLPRVAYPSVNSAAEFEKYFLQGQRPTDVLPFIAPA